MSLLPNDKLLNCNFETYRVNLSLLNRTEKEVDCELFDYNSKSTSFNISKVKSFGLCNNLILDEYNTNSVYFVSKDAKIYKTMYCEEFEKLSEPYNIFTANINLNKCDEQLPPNLFFISNDMACFADGYGYLHFIETSNRNGNFNGDQIDWKLLRSTKIFDDGLNSSLLECRVEYSKDSQPNSTNPLLGKLFHCCFMKISNKSTHPSSKNVDLLWVVYKFSDELEVVSKKLWKGNSPPEMVTFSNDFKTLDIVSNHHFRYISPDITVEKLSKENIDIVPHWCHDNDETILIEFYLNIAKQNFTLNFAYPTKENKELIIFVIINDKEPLELYKTISECIYDEEKTAWCMENELLLVTLKKIESEEDCEEIISKKPKMTTVGMEDVDNLDDAELGICSLNGSDGKLLGDEISISKNEWLFKTRLGPNQPISICLRFNVDGLVWTKLNSGDNWTHNHTLNAFGYVAAAKVDRKFVCCSLPNGVKNGIKFAVITDWKRELYVLMQSRRLDSNMRVKNRNTGQIIDNVADEFLVTLDKSKEIMGIVANDNVIFILYNHLVNGTGIAAINCC